MVVTLTELSAHMAYLISVNFTGCQPAVLGVVDKYRLLNAKLDLKYSCSRLKRSCLDDLDPHMIVDLCSTISRALSSITEVSGTPGLSLTWQEQNLFLPIKPPFS
jgi:hypothetical protein